MTKTELNHHANQMNPNSKAYKDCMDNHANQLNPNHKDSKEASGCRK